MDFAEKLRTLLSLTEAKSKMMASAVNIDSAQISRLRTGARKMPRDPKLIKSISDYLAERFDNDYRISALYELTGDPKLKDVCPTDTVSDIIYIWFTSDNTSSYVHVGNFLNRVNDYSEDELNSAPAFSSERKERGDFNDNIHVLMKNEGKRHAVIELCSSVIENGTPCTVNIFTDETDDWMLEDEDFMFELSELLKLFAQKGYTACRILPPSISIESALRDIERWLPAYMAGAIRLFYYPSERDELHRRSIVVVPEQCALYSMSLFGQFESEMTFLTHTPSVISSFDSYFYDVLERCQPMLQVYTGNERNSVIECIREISRCMASGVYKSSRLSAHTLPEKALFSLCQRATPYVRNILECYAQTEYFKAEVLRTHRITDIMTLPSPENVERGLEPVPGTFAGKDTLYYTANEYMLHLEHIVWYLETYPNYNVILLDGNELENVVIYTKSDESVLLVKEIEPFAVFKITERRFASYMAGYLRKLADTQSKNNSRGETIERLRNEIACLNV